MDCATDFLVSLQTLFMCHSICINHKLFRKRKFGTRGHLVQWLHFSAAGCTICTLSLESRGSARLTNGLSCMVMSYQSSHSQYYYQCTTRCCVWCAISLFWYVFKVSAFFRTFSHALYHIISLPLLFHIRLWTWWWCQVRVYSGKGSGQVRTETDEGQGQRAGQEISPAGVGDRLDSTTKDNERWSLA